MKFFNCIILFILISPATLYGQTQDIVKPAEINLPVHQSNIGKIIFTSSAIPVSALKESDFLQSYQLTNKSNLFITVFMGNSITNYMHQIAPSLDHDSLVKSGNYQFSLFIDNHLVYESNLWPGAPLAHIQDTATIISKPLIDYSTEGGWWSQSFWNRFMYYGGDSALTDGNHLLHMEIRPYVKMNEIKTGDIIASGELKLEVKRKPVIDISKIKLSAIAPYDGFAISKESFDSNKIKELIGNINEGVFKKINGVVVIRNGKILIEEYFNGENRSSLHDPRSVGKSFASTMTGIAIKDGYLKNESQSLKDFYSLESFTAYKPEKGNVTLKDLLTMSSAFDGNDDDGSSPGNEENMYPTDDWVKFTLDLPLNNKKLKGEWNYFTAGVVLLGDVLDKKVKGGLEKYADEKLFKPLHITNYQWQYTPQHVANTAGGIRMNALDFAKYGQLYKNGGKWNGKQIIPKEWVNKTFTKQKQIPGRQNEFYGYLFWNKTFTINGKTHETFYCAGNGGNYIMVFKNQPLVIVIMASAYGQSYAHPQVAEMMNQFILPAMVK